jgi:histone H3/H4
MRLALLQPVLALDRAATKQSVGGPVVPLQTFSAPRGPRTSGPKKQMWDELVPPNVTRQENDSCEGQEVTVTLSEALIVARALYEIKKMQSNAMAEHFSIPQAAFVRLVREITTRNGMGSNLRFQRDALVALQMLAENTITMVFEMW